MGQGWWSIATHFIQFFLHSTLDVLIVNHIQDTKSYTVVSIKKFNCEMIGSVFTNDNEYRWRSMMYLHLPQKDLELLS